MTFILLFAPLLAGGGGGGLIALRKNAKIQTTQIALRGEKSQGKF
jgi:hypothetical protein